MPVRGDTISFTTPLISVMKKVLFLFVLLLAAHLLQAQTSSLFATGFNQPYGLVFDASGSLYEADANGDAVNKVDAAGAIVTTYTGFNAPIALAIDAAGFLYVSNVETNIVSKINAAGTVTATYAGFIYPVGLAFDASGYLYVANELANTVNKVDGAGKIVATYTGFMQPIGLAFDATGGLFVANYDGNTVNKVDANGNITATYAGFSKPTNLSFDASDDLYVASGGGNSISVIPAGSGDGTVATPFISGLAYAPLMLTYHDNALYVSDGASSIYKISGGSLQTHYYVKLDASGANDGTTWSNAYTDLQRAIDQASAGDSVFVAATATAYQPASGSSFSMKEGVKIFGGFAGTETSFSQRNLSNKATLKGNGNSVIINDNNGLTADAELDGFIITGGSARFGGGMYNNNVSPIIRNCIFENNSADTNGNGGGMYNSNSSASIINCIFTSNTSGFHGGGIYNSASNVRLINCVVWANTTNNTGGGIYNLVARPVLTNTVIWDNTATIGGNGMVNGNSARPVVSFCDIQDQVWSGTGNISQDPLFTDAAAGDFSLQNLSPGINTGYSAANSSEVDLTGNPRIMGPSIDMGAIERSPVKYVKLEATGNSNGSSWKDAYTDLQTAVDAAIAGDSIFVATATYQPAIGSSFSMKEGVKIFGGFLGSENSFNQRSLSSKATLTGNGNSVIINDNNGLTALAVLDGFIITGGNADRGGGMYNNDHVFPVIRNCIFKNNSTSPTGNGGGMYNRQHAAPAIINCVFSGNTAGGNGGGMVNVSADPSIINCVFWGNSSGTSGGGMYNTLAHPVITNTIIWANTAVVNNRNGLFIGSGSSPVINYCNIQDKVFSGVGNISQDPLFTDAAGGDYTLKGISPCIDAGNSAANTTGTDLAGNARIVGTAIDMGAYESHDSPLPVALISFTGKLQNGIADLQWQTGVELDFGHFELQKGTDGNAFTTVISVNAKGDNSHYVATVPQTEPTAYYRLKMVNHSGTSKYSEVISLLQKAKANVSVYPNPAKDYINVKAEQAGSAAIYSVSGVLVKVLKLQAGINRIDVSDLASGSYFIVSGNNKIQFVKQ